MYGWAFSIQDSASGALSAITQNLNTATGAAIAARTKVESVGGAVKDLPPKIEINTSTIAQAVSSASDAVKYYREKIEELPEKWQDVRGSIVDALSALNRGDIESFKASVTEGLGNATLVLGDFSHGWQKLTTNVDGSANLIGKYLGIMGDKILNVAKAAASMGATFLTQTLPSVLKFVGQGVVSMAGYAASLMGATGAQAALNAVMLANPIGLIVAGIAAVGLAVYGLYAYWEDVKGYLVSFGKFFFENSPFGWIYNLIDNVFPNFKNVVSDTFQSIFGFIDKWFIQPFKWAISLISDEIKSITSEVSTMGVANSKTYDELMGKKSTPLIFANALADSGGSESVGKTAQSLGKKRGGGGLDSVGKAQSIEGGGGQIKNINIRIDKLVETVQNNFQSGGQMDERKIRETVTRALVDGVNDFNRQ